MAQGILLKVLIGILLVGNLGLAGYNATLLMARADFEDERESAIQDVVGIKRAYVLYKQDIKKISTENIISVDTPNGYFAERARIAGFDPMRNMNIPKKSDIRSLGSNFQEEAWKITFTKSYRCSMQKVARFCESIEAGSPQFQIKDVDLGKRAEIWGKDEWAPRSILVRRITRKSKKSGRR